MIFTGCEALECNNTPEEDNEAIEAAFEYQLNDDVRLYEEGLTSHVSLINDTTMFIGADMPVEHVPHVGDVIMCPSTANTPKGFLRRVISIEEGSAGMTVNTQPATLVDAFYTLKFEQKFNYAEYVKELRDSLGNQIPFEVLTGSVSEQLDSVKTDSKDDALTKINGELNSEQLTMKLDIGNRFFKGYAFIEVEIYVKYDIGFGKINEITYVIDKRVGLKGSASISTGELAGKDYEDDFSFSILDKSIPFGTPIGPPLMQFFPSLNFGIAFVANGNLSIEGEVCYMLEDTKNHYSYKNGVEHEEVINNLGSNESWMKMVSIEATGEFGIQGSAGIEFRLWNGDMLAIGGDASLWYGLALESSISMLDKNLLKNGSEITVNPSLSAALYIESFLINNRRHRIEAKVEKTFEVFAISLLPEFEFEELQGGNKLNVKPAVEPISMVEVSEQGLALFKYKSDTPITLIPLPVSTIIEDVPTEEYVDVQIKPETVEFTVPSDSNVEYYVKPYVVADEKYYYGDGGRWIDLGLPSGILWSRYNMGAEAPEEYGGYYAWGETKTKSSYTWENYKHGVKLFDPVENDWYWTGKKIGNNITNTKHDVAYTNWEDGARMPTSDELSSLVEHCSWVSSRINGVRGATITGPNGNSIFLPYAGGKGSGEFTDAERYRGLACFYWSSIENSDDGYSALGLRCYSADGEFEYFMDYNARNYGISIRPVKDK